MLWYLATVKACFYSGNTWLCDRHIEKHLILSSISKEESSYYWQWLGGFQTLRQTVVSLVLYFWIPLKYKKILFSIVFYISLCSNAFFLVNFLDLNSISSWSWSLTFPCRNSIFRAKKRLHPHGYSVLTSMPFTTCVTWRKHGKNGKTSVLKCK